LWGQLRVDEVQDGEVPVDVRQGFEGEGLIGNLEQGIYALAGLHDLGLLLRVGRHFGRLWSGK
jgi:hypothetical protein